MGLWPRAWATTSGPRRAGSPLDSANIALVIAIFSAIILPLLKFLLDQRKQGEEGSVVRRKQYVDENVTFASEWRKLYDEQEERTRALETQLAAVNLKLLAFDDMTRKNEALEKRVDQLEQEVERLMAALGYLTNEAAGIIPDQVKKAQAIAAGKEPPPRSKNDPSP